MRKSRLVILPTKCINQIGFLLLFLSCPVIGDWGRIQPESEASHRAVQVAREGTCGLKGESRGGLHGIMEENGSRQCRLRGENSGVPVSVGRVSISYYSLEKPGTRRSAITSILRERKIEFKSDGNGGNGKKSTFRQERDTSGQKNVGGQRRVVVREVTSRKRSSSIGSKLFSNIRAARARLPGRFEKKELSLAREKGLDEKNTRSSVAERQSQKASRMTEEETSNRRKDSVRRMDGPRDDLRRRHARTRQMQSRDEEMGRRTNQRVSRDVRTGTSDGNGRNTERTDRRIASRRGEGRRDRKTGRLAAGESLISLRESESERRGRLHSGSRFSSGVLGRTEYDGGKKAPEVVLENSLNRMRSAKMAETFGVRKSENYDAFGENKIEKKDSVISGEFHRRKNILDYYDDFKIDKWTVNCILGAAAYYFTSKRVKTG